MKIDITPENSSATPNLKTLGAEVIQALQRDLHNSEISPTERLARAFSLWAAFDIAERLRRG